MDTNLNEILKQLLLEKQAVAAATTNWTAIASQLVVPVIGVLISLAVWLKARAAEIHAKQTAIDVAKIEVSTNSVNSAMTTELKTQRTELARIATENARLTEQVRGFTPGPTIVPAIVPAIVPLKEVPLTRDEVLALIRAQSPDSASPP